MTILENHIHDTEQKLTVYTKEILRVHKDIARIGRVFRDVWLTEMMPVLGQVGNRDVKYENWRRDNRTVEEWYSIGMQLWCLFSINNDTAPSNPLVDPTLVQNQIATNCMMWVDKGNSTYDNWINCETLSICKAVSILAQDIYYLSQEYDVRLSSWVNDLGNGQTESYTGRTKEQWLNVRASLEAYHRCCFGMTTERSYGYASGLVAF